MQQKFFSKDKKGKDEKMLNFEKKCGKMPIDKCKKILFNKRKNFCEIQKNVKNFNHVLRKPMYNEIKVEIFFMTGATSCVYSQKWHHFFSKNLKNVNCIFTDDLYSDDIKYHLIIKLTCADFFVSSRNRRHNFEKFSKNLKNFNFVLRINGYHDNCILLRNADRIANRLCGILAINTINDDGYHITSLKNAEFSVKPVQIPIKWPEKKVWNVNDLLTITRYYWNCHINRFLKILRGVQSPVPRRKRTPVSMFKKSIYIINVFINQATDALRGLSINKIGDYVYSTTFKNELLVLFFDLLKNYLNSIKNIKFA